MLTVAIPAVIGISVGVGLYLSIGWWGFLILFPWIGTSISTGIMIRKRMPPERRDFGRKVSISLIAPSLLLFVPIANSENLQIEGAVLLLSIGSFSKGVVHYAIAKIFGPLIWGRGYCGWACWTAAATEWLPLNNRKRIITDKVKRLRYIALVLSVGIPLLLVVSLSYDVKTQYLHKQELAWMLTGNALYYALSFALAYYYQDKRAFCKVACPVAMIMKIPSQYSLLRRKPTGEECVSCGKCNETCVMDIDIMSYISKGMSVQSTECIFCNNCVSQCPVGAIK